MRCIGSRAKDADLWIIIWEELHRVHPEGTRVEAQHFNAHRSKKEMQNRSLFEKFITGGIEKADELAKEGARLDGGDVAQVRAITIVQEGQEVYAALQCAAGFRLVGERKDCRGLRPNP